MKFLDRLAWGFLTGAAGVVLVMWFVTPMDASFYASDREPTLLEQLAGRLGFEEVNLVQALPEAKVLHHVTEHGLILYTRARDAVARAPTRWASPTLSVAGH